jgi:hypothetical protein
MFTYITSCILSLMFGMILGKIIAESSSRGFSKKDVETLAWNRAQVAAENPNPKSRLYNDLPASRDNPWQAVYIRAIELLPKAIDELESEKEIKTLLLKEKQKQTTTLLNGREYMPK